MAATVESDGLEHTVLIDRACPNVAIAVVPGTAVADASVGALSEAVARGRPGTYDKDITGIFTGRFVWNRDRLPIRAIELISVRNLHTTAKTMPPQGKVRN
jgi:hypothetical protein